MIYCKTCKIPSGDGALAVAKTSQPFCKSSSLVVGPIATNFTLSWICFDQKSPLSCFLSRGRVNVTPEGLK